jgi:hypothetical protein
VRLHGVGRIQFFQLTELPNSIAREQIYGSEKVSIRDMLGSFVANGLSQIEAESESLGPML